MSRHDRTRQSQEREPPLQNRVTPLGELIAVTDRGLVYGNRGCLHDAAGTVVRSWAGRRWISCRLEFRGRRRERLMAPGRYTELFFLDEATAFAAGHRPCAECRREDYSRMRELWAARGWPARADAIDARLHRERLDSTGERRLHRVSWADLPDGAFVLRDGAPWVVHASELLRWTPGGYGAHVARPANAGLAETLTPPSLLALLRAGWSGAVPLLHPTVDE